jgi:hypothetical protein
MAIAGSKLGVLIAEYWHSGDDDRLIQRLRDEQLVRPDATDSELRTTFETALRGIPFHQLSLGTSVSFTPRQTTTERRAEFVQIGT